MKCLIFALIFFAFTALPGFSQNYIPSSGGSSVPITGEYPVDPTLLKNTREAFGKVRAGSGNAFVFCLGDSITAGLQLTGTNPTYNFSPPAELRKLLNSYAIPSAEWISFPVGASGLQPADSRWSGVASGSTNWSVVGTLGPGDGFGVSASPSTTAPLAFTPGYTIDTIAVYYFTDPSLGSLTVNVDGGSSLGTINSATTHGIASQSFSCSRGTHTINVVTDGTHTNYVLGIWAYDSTTPAVMICDGGVNGSKAIAWSDNSDTQKSLPAIATLAPNLVIVDLVANDVTTPTPIATYQSQMQSIFTAISAYSDILVIAGTPADLTYYTNTNLATELAYGALLQSMSAGSYGFINQFNRWISYPSAYSYSMYADGIHPSNIGATDKALTEFNAIK